MMDEKTRARWTRLREILAEVDDLQRAAALLSWDQQTYMPPSGAEARAEQMSTLDRLAQAAFVQPEVGDLLSALEPWAAGLPYESYEASLIRLARREYEKMVKIPNRLVAELAQATALATDAWVRAKEKADFESFRPQLERVLALTIEKAEALGYAESRYDALLDQFEPGMTAAVVSRVFDGLKARLIPLVQRISERLDRIDDDLLRQPYPVDRQWAFGLEVLQAMGFDLQRGRQDQSPHPFTTSFSSHDVRLTTKLYPEKFAFGLFATIHEGGHGLYEQGIPWELRRTPLAGAASLGVHESQSRLWENVIGRSRAFWQHFLPRLAQTFPEQLGRTDLEAFYRAVNRVQPSLIRVEADEVTYTLHIFVRFELEQKLIAGDLAIADLPAAWNERMRAYLGVEPGNAREGVLQDVHWSLGLIGYFPTYALGNLLSVQLYNRAAAERPEIPGEIAAGQFSALREWMKAQVHVHGAKLTPQELVRRATGQELQSEPYLHYIEAKYRDLYDLR